MTHDITDSDVCHPFYFYNFSLTLSFFDNISMDPINLHMNALERYMQRNELS